MHASMIIQIAIILVASRVIAGGFRRLRQPMVIGEMIAGILLGKSCLGWIAPQITDTLFPPDSLVLLNNISQVGLVLFLFVIGIKHDPMALHGRAKTAVLISHASITVPFALGTVLSLWLYPRLSDSRISFTEFALFLGTAMSITAFPVLARIIVERNLLETPVGSLALVTAAVDDVTGWLILAGVLLLVDQSDVSPWIAVPGTILYAVFMLTIARRALSYAIHFFDRRFRRRHPDGDPQAGRQGVLAFGLIVAFASAAITEELGVHPLFGAFLAGVAMPKEPVIVETIVKRVEDVTTVLLLPIFFIVSGLRTRIDTLSGLSMWVMFAAILIVAVAGKLGGASLAARASGRPWRESISVGILINTRGLVELVLLNIGYEAGIISQQLFTMMVLMAIVTTFMATPLFDRVYRREEKA
jgi:Kef-type K+ transport system membrane component KefB